MPSSMQNTPFKIDVGESIAKKLAENQQENNANEENKHHPAHGENCSDFTFERFERDLRLAARRV